MLPGLVFFLILGEVFGGLPILCICIVGFSDRRSGRRVGGGWLGRCTSANYSTQISISTIVVSDYFGRLLLGPIEGGALAACCFASRFC